MSGDGGVALGYADGVERGFVDDGAFECAAGYGHDFMGGDGGDLHDEAAVTDLLIGGAQRRVAQAILFLLKW